MVLLASMSANSEVPEFYGRVQFSPAPSSAPVLLVKNGKQFALIQDGPNDNPTIHDEKPAEPADVKKDPVIPGAVVAVIFGIFGLLIIARRKLR